MTAIADRQNNYIDRKLYGFILFLVVFIPFEDFVLKFMPVPDKIYFYARFLSELSVYGAFIAVCIQKVIGGKTFFRTPLDPPIFLFLQIAIVSAIANGSGLFESIVNIRPVFRYVVLFYIIVNIKISSSQANQILKYTIYAGVAQLGIALLQFLSRGALDSILQPRATDVAIGGATKDFVLLSGREIGSVYGATGDTILFASFTTLFLILILSKMYIINHPIFGINKSSWEPTFIKRNNILLSILIGITIVLTSFTYARICMMISIVIVLGYALLKFYKRKRIAILVIVFSLALPLLPFGIDSFAEFRKQDYSDNARKEQQSVLDNVSGIFTESYIHTARQQRLGAIVDIPSTVLFNKPFLGYGPDQLKTIDDLNNSKISFLTRKWEKQAFNDVYWSAQMAYYGIFGLFTLIWLFYRLQKWSRIIYHRTQNKVIKELSLSVIVITFTTIILLFFNQFIEFRIYGLYFWLFPALILNLYHQEKLSLRQKSRLSSQSNLEKTI